LCNLRSLAGSEVWVLEGAKVEVFMYRCSSSWEKWIWKTRPCPPYSSHRRTESRQKAFFCTRRRPSASAAPAGSSWSPGFCSPSTSGCGSSSPLRRRRVRRRVRRRWRRRRRFPLRGFGCLLSWRPRRRRGRRGGGRRGRRRFWRRRFGAWASRGGGGSRWTWFRCWWESGWEKKFTQREVRETAFVGVYIDRVWGLKNFTEGFESVR